MLLFLELDITKLFKLLYTFVFNVKVLLYLIESLPKKSRWILSGLINLICLTSKVDAPYVFASNSPFSPPILIPYWSTSHNIVESCLVFLLELSTSLRYSFLMFSIYLFSFLAFSNLAASLPLLNWLSADK